MAERYRKKPVEVEVVQWTGRNEPELRDFTGGLFRRVPIADRTDDPDITAQVWDALHSTWVGVKDRQHIIRGIKGEFYPIDPAVLDETYERITTPKEA